MDRLLDTAAGSVTYRDIRDSIAAEVRAEMRNPVVETFRNLRRMDAYEIANFDPLRPIRLGESFVAPDDFDDFDDSSVDSATGGRKPRSPNRYFYRIGEYETSTFYREFLSNQPVRSPCGRMVTLREMTDKTSRDSKSSFRAWFRMPLFKVLEIVDPFIAEGWVGLTHHC
jgi:hypothetical protein